MVVNPGPATEGVNVPVRELMPDPEEGPPNGSPPLSLKALALAVVTVSKHEAKLTIGARVPLMTIFAEVAGLPVTQLRLEVRMQLTVSLLAGLYV